MGERREKVEPAMTCRYSKQCSGYKPENQTCSMYGGPYCGTYRNYEEVSSADATWVLVVVIAVVFLAFGFWLGRILP